MVTEVIHGKDGQRSVHSNGKISIRSEYCWLSTDTKPTQGVENADIGFEMDTGKTFIFDEENSVWIEV